MLHLVELIDVESQQLSRLQRLDSKLSRQDMAVWIPFLKRNAQRLKGPNDINDSKVISNCDVDVRYVLIPRKDEGSQAFNEKKYAINFIIFHKNCLLLLKNLRFQQSTHPKDKRHVLVGKKLYVLVSLFVDIKGYLSLKLNRQPVKEFLKILEVFLALVSDGFFYPYV